MTIASLLRDYQQGVRTVASVVEELLAQGDDEVYANAWILRVDAASLRQKARAKDELWAKDKALATRLPLFGVPFAVKDNIDVRGLSTTAACPAFSYVAEQSATVVERLEAAGAILIGKTNLDQFATGLVGTRSPYGAVRNAFRPEYISGGSSSGSAIAVARGLVSFALGTDTAGSGRVPAGLNNIVGIKPSRGLISAHGVVPACQSLDCVSILSLTVADGARVLDVAAAHDPKDPYSRELPSFPSECPERFRFYVPDRLEFFGDEESRVRFDEAVQKLEALGGIKAPIDFSLFLETASLLYEGPWVAERLAAVRPFFESHQDDVHPVVRRIIGGSNKYSAADLFLASTRLQALRKRATDALSLGGILVVPTAPTAYTIEAVLHDPFETNRRMGFYTNFVNLLDLAACAVPASFRSDGLPFGITLIGRAGSDRMLADLGQRFHHTTDLPLGASKERLPPKAPIKKAQGSARLVVVGAHLEGLPLNQELTLRGAFLVQRTRTTPNYRLFVLPSTAPKKPGMVRDAADGQRIEVEVWEMPESAFGSFVAGIPAPLGIGKIELESGEWIPGFLCEAYATVGALEITHLGGWRAYLAASVA